MLTTKIGSFTYKGFYWDRPPTSRLRTDAPVNSPFAVEQLKQLCKDNKGLNEIIDISTGRDEKGENYILLIYADTVITEEQAKKLAKSFVKAIGTLTADYDDLDIAQWRYAEERADADKRRRQINATAVTSYGSLLKD